MPWHLQEQRWWIYRTDCWVVDVEHFIISTLTPFYQVTICHQMDYSSSPTKYIFGKLNNTEFLIAKCYRGDDDHDGNFLYKLWCDVTIPQLCLRLLNIDCSKVSGWKSNMIFIWPITNNTYGVYWIEEPLHTRFMSSYLKSYFFTLASNEPIRSQTSLGRDHSAIRICVNLDTMVGIYFGYKMIS